MVRVFIDAGLALLVSSYAAVACSPAEYEPRPLAMGPDCSFSIVHQFGGEVVGSPAKEMAAATFSQIISGGDETLLVTNCSTGAQLNVTGWLSISDWVSMIFLQDCTVGFELDKVLPPTGILQLSGETTLADVRAVAINEGHFLAPWVPSPYPGFDPFCPCALNYPESVGAELSRSPELIRRN